MANILLTETCVRSCPYCFAKKYISNKKLDDILSWENLIYVTEFLIKSGEHHVSLLGGEPTLHPDFVPFVLYLVERGIHITVFTSGIISTKKMEEMKQYLLKIHPDKLSFLCNLNNPNLSTETETKKIDQFLYEFGQYTQIGVNVYKLNFYFDYIIQHVNSYGLRRAVRLGLAHPIPDSDKENVSVKLEELEDFGKMIIDQIDKFYAMKIELNFDCGFPLCIFNDEQLGRLWKLNKGQLKFNCGAVIDIGADLSVWSCFPLTDLHKRSLYEFDSFEDLFKYYDNIHRAARTESSGLYDKCDSCEERKNNLCSGGCLAHVIRKFQNEKRVRFPEVYLS